MDSSYASSEGLGLGGGSVLSLERLGDGLVRDLASTTVDRSSVDSVGNRSSVNKRSSVDSVGNRGSMNNRSSVDNRGSVSRSIGILSSAVIGDLSDVSIVGIRVVVDMLGAAVREVDIVRTLGIASSVTGLGSIEVGGGVVVSNGVVVCVGGDLVRVNLGSSVHNWSVVGRGSVDYRSSMHHRGSVNHGCSVNYRGNSMSDSVSSN